LLFIHIHKIDSNISKLSYVMPLDVNELQMIFQGSIMVEEESCFVCWKMKNDVKIEKRRKYFF
jgi:thioredoxin-related protein